MITIIDCGTNNLGSMANMLNKIGQTSRIASAPDQLEEATKIIVPGVGSFDAGMQKLTQSGMIPLLNRKVIEERVPTLGICLGMHLMTRSSEEGMLPGLGWVAANTVRFNQVADPNLRVPHMGWNAVAIPDDNPVFKGVPRDSYFYFVHSYYADPSDDSWIVGTTDYGGKFTSVLSKDNVVATQFHPEKSGAVGLQLYDNFMKTFVLGNA